MKKLMMLAGATALVLAVPALAKPGNGNGWGHENGRGHGHDFGYDERGPEGYGVGGCPPGLAKKHNGCMPPGHARKLFRGDRYQYGYGSYYSYGRIPHRLRVRYGLSPYDHYYYHDGYLYRVNRRTMVIEQVINALLH